MLSKNLDLYSPYYGNNIIIRDITTGKKDPDLNYFL